jgi:hypothetical protein
MWSGYRLAVSRHCSFTKLFRSVELIKQCIVLCFANFREAIALVWPQIKGNLDGIINNRGGWPNSNTGISGISA